MHIYAYFCYARCLPSPNKGFHKGGRAAEGRPPPLVEAAEGRLLYWGWGGGKHSKSIGEYLSKIYACVYLADFPIFPSSGPWSYLISGIRIPVLPAYIFNICFPEF